MIAIERHFALLSHRTMHGKATTRPLGANAALGELCIAVALPTSHIAQMTAFPAALPNSRAESAPGSRTRTRALCTCRSSVRGAQRRVRIEVTKRPTATGSIPFLVSAPRRKYTSEMH